jgi:hypothetical protein
MPNEITLCQCDCGCGRVTRSSHPICPLCLDKKHPNNPFLPPKGSESVLCGDCDGFLFFDKRAKMFLCGPFCPRSELRN